MFGIDAMTPADFRHPSRSRFLRGVKLTLLVAAAAWLAAPTTARAQTDYALSNVSAVLNGTPISISGNFTVVPGFAEYFASFVVTAPLDTYGGDYSCGSCNGGNGPGTNPVPVSPNSVVAEGPGGRSIQIGFAGGSITSVSITSGGTTVTDSAPTGTAVVTGYAADYGFFDASTVVNGTREPITGGFTFDPSTGIQYGGIMNVGLYGELGADTENLGIGAHSVDGLGFSIDFANSLSYFDDDPLLIVALGGLPVDYSPTGFVCPGSCSATVPEPTSLALLGAALGLFLVSSRAIRRPGQPHPDKTEGA